MPHILDLRSTLLVLAALTTGCVSKKRYTALQDELARAQTQRDIAAATAEGRADQISDLEDQQQRLQDALDQLRADEAAAAQRSQRYAELVRRFQSMIDSGDLRVKIDDNRMVVEVGSDILFGSGSADLSEDGIARTLHIGQVLADVGNRGFQIEGHTDSLPIHSDACPSNWELGSARATAVATIFLDAGMQRDQLSVASYADTQPVATNDTDDGRTRNRRIEIVLLPDLDLLPPIADAAVGQ